MSRNSVLLLIIILLFQISYAEEQIFCEQDNGYRLMSCEQDGNYVYRVLDNNGEQIGDAWPFIGQINDGYAIIGNDQHYGIMDTNGIVTVIPQYTYIQYMGNAVFCATKDNKMILLTGAGETIKSLENAEPVIIDGNYVVFDCYETGRGLLCADGRLILDPVWESVGFPCCGIIRASEDRCCYFDQSGKEIFQCEIGFDFF